MRDADLALSGSLLVSDGAGGVARALVLDRRAHWSSTAMFASLVSTPVVVSLARADGVASHRASRASASVPTVASSTRGDADRVALTRRGILGAAALAAFASPAPAHARRANKLADLSSLSPAEQRYAESTLNLIAQTSALVDGQSTDVDAWLAQSQAWYGEAKDSYSPKSQGKSFLMTTKLVAYLKNAFATLPASGFDASDPPFDVAKTKEWIGYAEGFTSGALAGDEARAAFARATWGNYDKSAPLNRFGLCAFGETGGTRALGVDCEGY